MPLRSRMLVLSIPCLLVAFVAPSLARTWEINEAKVEFSLPEGRLSALGLSVVGATTSTTPDDDAATGMEGPVFAFAVDAANTAFRTEGGLFAGFEPAGTALLAAHGGFALRAEDPATKRALSPAFLYDLRIEIEHGAEETVRLRGGAAEGSSPLAVRHAELGIDPAGNALVVRAGDLVISESWAAALGRPELAGQWIGTLAMRMSPAAGEELEAPERPDAGDPRGALLDVELAELYGVQVVGRDVAYPNGSVALSAATTSCNPGDVNVPWNAPMAETHPFIGLAFFRLDAGGTLEMIGKSWIKHGFFALDSNDCGYGCQATGGSTLGVGCSDTYGVGNNASRFYLGPREEVNPHTAAWEACGSFFDGVPVDCQRSYNGNESSEVAHRMEVWDEDLGNPGARYFYEGSYYVADDDVKANNFGWKECSVSFSSGEWTFSDFVPFPTWPQRDNDGLLVDTWGDQRTAAAVSADDGIVTLSVKVTDLGGGQWHYEYAFYNRDSDRGIRSFTVPTGGANVTNASFHDIDKDPANDWTVQVTPGEVTWFTDDYATDPDAPALKYQEMFNFRFDADAAPQAATVRAGIFKPGVGTELVLDTLAPPPGAVSARAGNPARTDFALRALEPNPFRAGTQVAFSLDRRREVRLSVVDVTGRTVRVLLDGAAPAGASTVRWDSLDEDGSRLAGGVYFFRLESGGEVRTAKGTLLR